MERNRLMAHGLPARLHFSWLIVICGLCASASAEGVVPAGELVRQATRVASAYKTASESCDYRKMVGFFSKQLIEGNGGYDRLLAELKMRCPADDGLQQEKIYNEVLGSPTVIHTGQTWLIAFPVDRHVLGLDDSVEPILDMYAVVSRDGGKQWNVVPGSCMTEDDVQRLFVPSYRGVPALPTPRYRAERMEQQSTSGSTSITRDSATK